jgi:hypothetical protein
VSLSSNGNRVAIGAPNGSGSDGRVRVYQIAGGNWVQRGLDIELMNGDEDNAVPISSIGTICRSYRVGWFVKIDNASSRAVQWRCQTTV